MHGTLVAVQQGGSLWAMFFFGFAGIFVITQMYGLPLKPRVRWMILGAYLLAAAAVYSQLGWVRLNEIIRIPLIEYLGVGLLALIFAGGLWLARKITSLRRASTLSPAD